MRNRFKINRFIWSYLELVDYLCGKSKVLNFCKSFSRTISISKGERTNFSIFLFVFGQFSGKNQKLRTVMWVSLCDSFGGVSFKINVRVRALIKCSWNWPSTKKRSGLNTSGRGKSFGLCITAKKDAITRDPFFTIVPSILVSWMHKWGRESRTGRNLKFSSKTALKYGHWSTMNFPFFEKHWSSSW